MRVRPYLLAKQGTACLCDRLEWPQLLCCCCRVLVPKYWTQVGVITFNFTGFDDTTDSVADYQWGLGTSSGMQNTLPYQSVTGSAIKFTSFALNTLVSRRLWQLFSSSCQGMTSC